MKSPPKSSQKGGGTKGGGIRAATVLLRNARARTTASQAWLNRQLNDPYVRAAKAQGFRSRAAFKLMELDDRFHLLRRNITIVDLGAAPGGWTQLATRKGASVLALDILPMDPIPGATILQGDFTDETMPAQLLAHLGTKADLVLSDMAPNTTGHTDTDHLRIMALADMALDFALQILAPNGAFVAKLFQGGSERGMLLQLKKHFASVKHAKPPASRKESSELYVIATGFRLPTP